jgi:6-phosphofructokinase 1
MTQSPGTIRRANNPIKRIAVLTSGGDAPGMNAAVRAVTRCAIDQGWEVFGVKQGYAGLIEGHFIRLHARSVGGIIQRGGTFLGSARCLEFLTIEGRNEALAHLHRRGIEGVVIIGGDGSQTGAAALAQSEIAVVGVASTIDNDLIGSDITIGVDTALNIALEAIDRLRTTASSHQRAFLVEVMGRRCGYLALMAGIAGGAEVVAIPEAETGPEIIARDLCAAYERGKTHAIAVVAEGAQHNATALTAYFAEHHSRIGFDLRVTTLGHVQRGGQPTAYDRLLATRLGAGAVATLARGECGVLMGMLGGRLCATPLADVAGRRKALDSDLIRLAHVLAQ